MRKDDWICTNCITVIFKDKNSCMKCGKNKPANPEEYIDFSTGKAKINNTLKNKPPVIRKDNDWKCDNCGGINFAKRDKCYSCSHSNKETTISECKICFGNIKNRVSFTDCGHAQFCEECVKMIPNSKCPICNKVSGYKRIFID